MRLVKIGDGQYVNPEMVASVEMRDDSRQPLVTMMDGRILQATDFQRTPGPLHTFETTPSRFEVLRALFSRLKSEALP